MIFENPFRKDLTPNRIPFVFNTQPLSAGKVDREKQSTASAETQAFSAIRWQCETECRKRSQSLVWQADTLFP